MMDSFLEHSFTCLLLDLLPAFSLLYNILQVLIPANRVSKCS
jgi:hypothetical protein